MKRQKGKIKSLLKKIKKSHVLKKKSYLTKLPNSHLNI